MTLDPAGFEPFVSRSLTTVSQDHLDSQKNNQNILNIYFAEVHSTIYRIYIIPNIIYRIQYTVFYRYSSFQTVIMHVKSRTTSFAIMLLEWLLIRVTATCKKAIPLGYFVQHSTTEKVQIKN